MLKACILTGVFLLTIFVREVLDLGIEAGDEFVCKAHLGRSTAGARMASDCRP